MKDSHGINKSLSIKAKTIKGKQLTFKDVTIDDAEFIINTRTNPKKNAYISKTEYSTEQQIEWIKSYNNDFKQAYFIIFNEFNERIGTIRMYDIVGDSFSWGSWILIENIPSSHAIESALMIYQYGLKLGFERAHFSVRKSNTSVWRFHEKFGSEKINETTEDYFYSISNLQIKNSLERYKKYLPDPIEISHQ